MMAAPASGMRPDEMSMSVSMLLAANTLATPTAPANVRPFIATFNVFSEA